MQRHRRGSIKTHPRNGCITGVKDVLSPDVPAGHHLVRVRRTCLPNSRLLPGCFTRLPETGRGRIRKMYEAYGFSKAASDKKFVASYNTDR